MLVDQQTNEIYIPMNDLQCPQDGQGHLEVVRLSNAMKLELWLTFLLIVKVANSILSEEAVLGFEYGTQLI